MHPRAALARLVAEPSAGHAHLPLVISGLQAGPGQPPIIARRAWALGVAHPRVAPEYGSVQLAFVHHTENPDGYSAAEVPAMLRAIFDFHRYTHGWNDIGYNFVIDRFGRIFEARAGGIDEPVTGAQAGGYNAYSTGIAILGTYSSQRISSAALTALEHLLAWKLSLHGAPVQGRVTVRVTRAGAVYSRFPANTPVSLPRVAGHRDADSTDCPGDALYGELPSLRRRAVQLAGHPVRATLLSQAADSAGGAPTTLAGSLRFLTGMPIAGAIVEIQELTVARKGEVVTERIVGSTVTAPDGGWSLPIAVSPGAAGKTALRAISAGAPNLSAAVSDPLQIAGSVSFSQPATPAPEQAPAPSAPGSPPPAA
ncbi:MAG: N-acetylmuramoyl-L-alanine amidase [Solirubrobacteraceae bacterium]